MWHSGRLSAGSEPRNLTAKRMEDKADQHPCPHVAWPAVKFRVPIVVSACLMAAACDGKAEAMFGKPSKVNAEQLVTERIHVEGKLGAAFHIADQDGAHILVLSRKLGPSPAAPGSGRIERVDLFADYYRRLSPGRWQREWTIRDMSDCPGLDVDGDFFIPQVRFTDLNRDGKAEVTVPYRLFCGGGVAPSTVKVILREGVSKLAIRGESLVRVRQPGVEAFGGERQLDAALDNPERARYKQHMTAVWDKVAIEER